MGFGDVIRVSFGIVFAVLIGQASWYSAEACRFNKDAACPTASGASLYQLERDGVLFAASYDIPLHSAAVVTNIKTGRSVRVIVLDRGPNRRLNRVIDLSKSAFSKIADLKQGVINVSIEEVEK